MSNRKSLFHLRSLPPTVAALAVVGLSGSALAQVGNPTTGATLYKTPVAIPNGVPLACENCHGAANVFNIREGTDAAIIAAKDQRRDRRGRQLEDHESVRRLVGRRCALTWRPTSRAATAASTAAAADPATGHAGASACACAGDAGTAEHDADDEPRCRPLQQHRDRQGKRDQRRARDQQHVGSGQVRDAGLRAAGGQAQRIRLDDRPTGQHQLRARATDCSQEPAARSGFALPRWRRECARRRGRSSSKTTFRRATSHLKVRRSPARLPRRAPTTPRTVGAARSVSARSSASPVSRLWDGCADVSASRFARSTDAPDAATLRRISFPACDHGRRSPNSTASRGVPSKHRPTYAASIR